MSGQRELTTLLVPLMLFASVASIVVFHAGSRSSSSASVISAGPPSASSTLFVPSSIVLGASGSSTVSIDATEIPSDANSAQFYMLHSGDVAISDLQCLGLFSGSSGFGPSSVNGGTLIGCSLNGGTVQSVSGLAAQFTVSSTSSATSSIRFAFEGDQNVATGLGTGYAVDGIHHGPGAINELQIAPVTVPDPPVSVQAMAGEGSAAVSWTPPANDGGLPIEFYTVLGFTTDFQHDPGSSTLNTSTDTVVTATTTATSTTIAGLEGETLYRFSVTATNAVGASASSSPSSFVDPLIALRFEPSTLDLTLGSSANVQIRSSGIPPLANSAVFPITHGDAVAVSNVQCSGLFAGADLTEDTSEQGKTTVTCRFSSESGTTVNSTAGGVLDFTVTLVRDVAILVRLDFGVQIGTGPGESSVVGPDIAGSLAIRNGLNDFGDAPDPTYPSKAGSNGIRHAITSVIYLGATSTAEADSNQSGDTGDDGLISSRPLSIQPTGSLLSTGFLNVLVDYNDDGDWEDVGEHLVVDGSAFNPFIGSLGTFVHELPLHRWIRISLTESEVGTGWDGTGEFLLGETEDYFLTEHLNPMQDFGDAPEPGFPSAFASDGIRHGLAGGVGLGFSVTEEPDSIQVDSDDDDGLISFDPITLQLFNSRNPGDVPVSGAGYVNVLTDLDRSGSWESPTEWVVQNQFFTIPPPNPGGPGLTTLDTGVSAASNAWTRITVTLGPISDFDGTGNFREGETEDYFNGARDYGDAPDPSFPSSLTSNGSRHADVGTVYLGATSTAELDSQRFGDAGDDGLTRIADEITVTITNATWTASSTGATSTEQGVPILYLNLLIDEDHDGGWSQADDWTLQNATVPVSAGASTVVQSGVPVPIGRWFRISVTTEPIDSYDGTGHFLYGETEDYFIVNDSDEHDPFFSGGHDSLTSWMHDNALSRFHDPAFSVGDFHDASQSLGHDPFLSAQHDAGTSWIHDGAHSNYHDPVISDLGHRPAMSLRHDAFFSAGHDDSHSWVHDASLSRWHDPSFSSATGTGVHDAASSLGHDPFLSRKHDTGTSWIHDDTLSRWHDPAISSATGSAAHDVTVSVGHDAFFSKAHDSGTSWVHDSSFSVWHDPLISSLPFHNPARSLRHDPFLSANHDPATSWIHDGTFSRYHSPDLSTLGTHNPLASATHDTIISRVHNPVASIGGAHNVSISLRHDSYFSKEHDPATSWNHDGTYSVLHDPVFSAGDHHDSIESTGHEPFLSRQHDPETSWIHDGGISVWHDAADSLAGHRPDISLSHDGFLSANHDVITSWTHDGTLSSWHDPNISVIGTHRIAESVAHNGFFSTVHDPKTTWSHDDYLSNWHDPLVSLTGHAPVDSFAHDPYVSSEHNLTTSSIQDGFASRFHLSDISAQHASLISVGHEASLSIAHDHTTSVIELPDYSDAPGDLDILVDIDGSISPENGIFVGDTNTAGGTELTSFQVPGFSATGTTVFGFSDRPNLLFFDRDRDGRFTDGTDDLILDSDNSGTYTDGVDSVLLDVNGDLADGELGSASLSAVGDLLGFTFFDETPFQGVADGIYNDGEHIYIDHNRDGTLQDPREGEPIL